MLKRVLECRAGAVAAEYAVILGIIGAAVAAAAVVLSTSISQAIEGIAALI